MIFADSRLVSANSILINMFFHMPVIAFVFILRIFQICLYFSFYLLSPFRHHSSALYSIIEQIVTTQTLLVKFKNSPKRLIIPLILVNTFLIFFIFRLKYARIFSLKSNITFSHLIALKRNLIFSPPISISTSSSYLYKIRSYFYF